MKTLVRTSSKVNAEFIGLDVHRTMTVFTVLNRRGEDAAAGEFPTCRKDLVEFLDEKVGRKLSHVVFEASGSTEWIYDEIVSRYGPSRVHVAHPKSIRMISRSTQKNDANDSWWLAYMGQEGRLPSAVIPSPAYRELRFAVRHRISLVQARTKIVTALRSDLTAQGERLAHVKFDTPENRIALDDIATRWTGVRRLGLTQARARLASLDEQVAEWDAMIETLSGNFPEVETLEREIPGVGPVLAATICAEAADVRRFTSAKAFGRYTGMTPTDRSTGGKTLHGAITREGSPYLRWALVQAVVHCAIAKHGPGVSVGGWYRAKCLRMGNKKKARVATARKLAEAIWRLFHLGETFDLKKPFGIHEPAA
jgi:transposase